jgi:hypothetical protein
MADSKLICVHRGKSGDDSLWWCTFDGSKWTEDKKFSEDNRSASAPALVNLNGTIYCIHRGSNDDFLWWCMFDGTKWTKDTKFSEGNRTAEAPAVALY